MTTERRHNIIFKLNIGLMTFFVIWAIFPLAVGGQVSIPTDGAEEESAAVSIENAADTNDPEPATASPTVETNPPPNVGLSPRLITRRFSKSINISHTASHGCELITFRVDLSSKNGAMAQMILRQDAYRPHELEIGALPYGINVVFSDNLSYSYQPVGNAQMLQLTINKQSGAQRGDFSIPIIFTAKGAEDSTVVCQLNIVNL